MHSLSRCVLKSAQISLLLSARRLDMPRAPTQHEVRSVAYATEQSAQQRPEHRLTRDGFPYTRLEFIEWYRERADDLWSAAPFATERGQRAHLYLDYNGVLNSGDSGDLCDFIVDMDHLPVNINLLSYPPGGSGRTTTLQEITEAGIGDLFDKIVFTMHRTAAEHQAIATEHARPQLE